MKFAQQTVAAAVLLIEPWTRLLRDGVLRRSPAAARETLQGFVLLWRAVVRGTLRPEARR